MKWDAAQYDAAKAPQIDAGRELIALAGVREHDAILDLGCGTGKLTIELARLASKGSVVGIDPSEEMLDKARAVASGADNMSLIKAPAEDLEFIERFDLAFSNSAIQWVKDQPKAASRVYQALKPGGRIAFQFPAKDFCGEFFDAVDYAVAALGYERFYQRWQSPWKLPAGEEFGSLLSRAGFSSVEVSSRKYRLAFMTTEDVVAWWSSAGLRPYLAALPGTGRQYFQEAFAENFGKNRTERGIEFNFTRMFAFAKKQY
jgi:trans-aconitate 2-methyltransferase